MIQLYNKRTGESIGAITEAQLQFLIDQLEEETSVDQDYAITPMTLDYFVAAGADPTLVEMLRQALGTKDEITILWLKP